MNHAKIRVLIIGLFLFLGFLGCGSHSSTATVTASVKLSSDSSSIGIMFEQSMKSMLIHPPILWPSLELRGPRAMTAGGATAAQLTSLKYFITGISICQGLTTTETAYSDPYVCVPIYQGPTDATLNPASGATIPSDYGALATYATSSTTGYLDLMDSTSRATIATGGSLSSAAALKPGDYSWGIITWAYPIKATATLDAGGTTLYTRSGTTDATGITTASTPLTTASAQEAVVTLPNGGTWFHFQNPFKITSSDTAASVALTFNPDNLIRGFAANGSSTPSNLSYSDGAIGTGNEVNIPFLDLTPVPLRASDQAIVETYTSASLTGTTDTFSIRLELYYSSTDTNRSIYGATLRVIPASTSQYATDIAQIASITAGSTAGTLDFNDYAGNPIIAAFTRRPAVSEATTATIPCAGAYSTTTFSPAGCASGSSLSATFQLTSIAILN